MDNNHHLSNFEKYRIIYYKKTDEFFIFNKLSGNAVFITDKRDQEKLLSEENCFECINEPLEHVGFEITKQCNLKCLHCWQGEHKPQLHFPIENIKTLFSRLSELGLLTIRITGGEPLLHPHFWSILDEASKFDFSIIIGSNGILLDENAAKKLSEYPINLVELSLDGSNSFVHDNFRGVKGAFNSTTKAMGLLIENNILTSIKTVIHQNNLDDLLDLANFLYKDFNQITTWTLKDLLPCGNAEVNQDLILPKATDLIHTIKKIVNWSKINENPLQIEGYSIQLIANPEKVIEANQLLKNPCDYKNRYLYIEADGTIKRCALVKKVLGHTEEDLIDIWNNNYKELSIEVPDPCLSCTYYKKKLCGHLSYVCPAIPCFKERKQFFQCL